MSTGPPAAPPDGVVGAQPPGLTSPSESRGRAGDLAAAPQGHGPRWRGRGARGEPRGGRCLGPPGGGILFRTRGQSRQRPLPRGRFQPEPHRTWQAREWPGGKVMGSAVPARPPGGPPAARRAATASRSVTAGSTGGFGGAPRPPAGGDGPRVPPFARQGVLGVGAAVPGPGTAPPPPGCRWRALPPPALRASPSRAPRPGQPRTRASPPAAFRRPAPVLLRLRSPRPARLQPPTPLGYLQRRDPPPKPPRPFPLTLFPSGLSSALGGHSLFPPCVSPPALPGRPSPFTQPLSPAPSSSFSPGGLLPHRCHVVV